MELYGIVTDQQLATLLLYGKCLSSKSKEVVQSFHEQNKEFSELTPPFAQDHSGGG